MIMYNMKSFNNVQQLAKLNNKRLNQIDEYSNITYK